MQHGNFKRYKPIGPGGINCPCCGPAPGLVRTRAKRQWKRAERATMRRQLEKESE